MCLDAASFEAIHHFFDVLQAALRQYHGFHSALHSWRSLTFNDFFSTPLFSGFSLLLVQLCLC